MKSQRPEAGCTAALWYKIRGKKKKKKGYPSHGKRWVLLLVVFLFVWVIYLIYLLNISMYVWELMFVLWGSPSVFVTALIHTV